MEVIPERGDTWWVALEPTLSSEIRKTSLRRDFG
jgi:hypothetical protein